MMEIRATLETLSLVSLTDEQRNRFAALKLSQTLLDETDGPDSAHPQPCDHPKGCQHRTELRALLESVALVNPIVERSEPIRCGCRARITTGAQSCAACAKASRLAGGRPAPPRVGGLPMTDLRLDALQAIAGGAVVLRGRCTYVDTVTGFSWSRQVKCLIAAGLANRSGHHGGREDIPIVLLPPGVEALRAYGLRPEPEQP